MKDKMFKDLIISDQFKFPGNDTVYTKISNYMYTDGITVSSISDMEYYTYSYVEKIEHD